MPQDVPATMATQHPDNAFTPYWAKAPFVSTSQEVEECYRSFADLNCQEYMWDWEGKFVDEAVVDRLLQTYYDFFKKNPLGENFRLTYRIPNIAKEGQARLVRAFSGILSASYTAHQLKFKQAPLYEIIHPMTTSVEQLKTLQRRFHETVKFHRKISGIKNLQPNYIGIIPLIEGTGALLKSRKILEQYTRFSERFAGHRPEIIRPFIARSDPALDGGFVAAILSAKAAISEYYTFAKESGVKVRPMIGVGSLHFRGGLSPETIDDFLATYPGVRTVTVQSSFRYDHPFEEVKKAVAKLNRKLPQTTPDYLSPREQKDIWDIEKHLVHYYRSTIENLASFINQMADHIPPRRERLQHTGHFGYSRQVGKKGIALPRAISFTAVFYSLGIPPELIGLGRALMKLHQEKLLTKLVKLYPQLHTVLEQVGRYFNEENLEILIHHHKPWRAVKTGIAYIEDFLSKKLGPVTPDELLHRNYTSNVIQNWLKKQPLTEDILKAAQMRRSLG